MTGNSDARAAILGSIRSALGPATDVSGIAAGYAAIPRAYKRKETLETERLLSLFEERVREYDAGFLRTTAARVQTAIASLLAARERKVFAIPEGLNSDWLPEGFEFHTADRLDCYQLDQLEGAITGCTVAVAQTGSIVLQNAPGQGPRCLSLVPDYHLCVVFADQVVETVPECFERLQATSNLPTTFFSGPSATADIEMTRIKGVHGPRFLDVLLVL